MDALTKHRSPTRTEKAPPPSHDDAARPRDESHATDDAASDAKTHCSSSWKDTLHRRPWLTAALGIAALCLVVAGILWWLHARQFESTDDAFIDARTVSISAQVAGA